MAEDSNDIQRYLKGEMSESEQYAFEKRALSDPFLSDAVEGAEKIPPDLFTKDVEALSHKINEKKNVWPVTIRIAAGIAIVITVGWFALRDTQPNHELALQKSDSTVAPKPDSSGQLLTMAESRKDKADVKTGPQLAKTQLKEKQIEKTVVKIPPSEAAGASAQSQPVLSDKTKTTDDLVTEEVASTKAIEEEKARNVEPSAAMKKETAPQRAAMSSSQKTALDADLKSDSVKGCSIVVQTEVSGSPSIVTGSPQGGILAYCQYLEKNRRMPKEALDANIHSNVVLTFTVLATGDLNNFKIVSSPGYGCDEELVRLIKAGPKWAPTVRNGQQIPTSVRATLPFYTDR